jgi:hypothetical protein
LISKSIKRGFQCALFYFFNQKSKNAATMKRLVIYGPGVLLPEIYDFYAFKSNVFPISPKGIEARLSSSLSWYVKVSCRLETIFYYYFIEWKSWMGSEGRNGWSFCQPSFFFFTNFCSIDNRTLSSGICSSPFTHTALVTEFINSLSVYNNDRLQNFNTKLIYNSMISYEPDRVYFNRNVLACVCWQ